MKKRYLFIDICFLLLLLFSFTVKHHIKYGLIFDHKPLKSKFKRYKEITIIEQLMKDLLTEDQPTELWLSNYSDQYISPENSFYYWKVYLLLDDITKKDFKKFRYEAICSYNSDTCPQLEVIFPHSIPVLSVCKHPKDSKVLYHFAFVMNNCLYHPNTDINYDNNLDYQDYADLKMIKKTGIMPEHIKRNKERFLKEAEEAKRRWEKEQSNELDALDNIEEINEFKEKNFKYEVGFTD